MDSVKKINSVNLTSNRLIDALDLVETNQDNLMRSECFKRGKDFWHFGRKNKESYEEKVEINEKCKMITDGLWEKFARTTTGHGFARMVDNNEPSKFRIFWGIALMFLTIGLFTSIFVISYDSLVVRGLRRGVYCKT